MASSGLRCRARCVSFAFTGTGTGAGRASARKALGEIRYIQNSDGLVATGSIQTFDTIHGL